ncbi:MAG TPA: MFS transporter [Microbacterium sp.]|nr:MFS transporter [Microbacterium sp.]
MSREQTDALAEGRASSAVAAEVSALPIPAGPSIAVTGTRRRLDGPGALSRIEILLLIAGTLGAALAYLVPMVFTLALKIDLLDRGNEAVLGYILGIGSVVTLLTAPLTGILSDRTRTRWGRRRPFAIGGMIVGIGAIALMAMAQDLVALGAGWVLSNLGWGTALGSIGNIQADRLSAAQRGKVGALTGVVTQVAPVTGVLLVGPIVGDIGLAMWLPTLVGIPLVLLFVVFVREADSRGAVFDHRLTVGSILRSYLFRPSAHPAFAWNWLGRFLFFFGITFTSTYSTFFLASRMELSVQEIAPIVGLMSAIGTAVSALGAVAAGWLSDRWGRRRPFILASVCLYAAGAGVSAFATDLPVLIVGAVLTSLGVALFLAINQAMVLDVLPLRDTQAGRFMGITAFSQKIPNALAPLLAPVLLATGGVAGENYTLLYLSAGAFALLGGLLICFRVTATADSSPVVR